MPFDLKQDLFQGSGYRYNLDSFLLTYFSQCSADDFVLDLGCGNGIILFLLVHQLGVKNLVGIEIQDQLFEQAKKNRDYFLNQASIELIHGDVRTYSFQDKFDKILCNPPYRKIGSGRIPPDPQKRMARFEATLTMQDIFIFARSYLKEDGALHLIYPLERKHDFQNELMGKQLYLKRTREVISFPGQAAKWFLAELVRSPMNKVIYENPLIVWQKVGVYSDELVGFFEPKIN